MEKEVLKRYFERSSSETESKAVEEWLLDPANKIAFENFLEEEWKEHSGDTVVRPIHDSRKSTRRSLWKAASVAALLCVTLGAYHLYPDSSPNELPAADLVQIKQDPLNEAKTSSPAPLQQMSDSTRIIQPKTVPHEKKKTRPRSSVIAARTDTASQQIKPKSIQASKLAPLEINKAQLAKLVEKIDSNQFVFNVNMHEATYHRLAYLLRKEYGIVLELCSETDTKKTYSARFEKISIHDLLNDMSEKMAFTYTFQDNKIKICF